MKTVEIRMAFVWTCDECGRDSFERAITPDIGISENMKKDEKFKETMDRMRAEMGFADNEMISLQVECTMAPMTVTCKHCGTEYETTPSGELGLFEDIE